MIFKTLALSLFALPLLAAPLPPDFTLERGALRGSWDKLTPEDLAKLAELDGVRSLRLSGDRTHFRGRHLDALTGLQELEEISFDGANLDDAAYAHFAKFPKLRRLSLFHVSQNVEGFTGKGFTALQKCPALESLVVAGAYAGDEAFKAIAGIRQLEEFRQWHNVETVKGMTFFADHPNLRALKIGQRLARRGFGQEPSFVGATIGDLAEIPALEEIEIVEARLTFDELQPLTRLENLKKLVISKTDVPPADIERLRKDLPGVKIDFTKASEADLAYLREKLKM